MSDIVSEIKSRLNIEDIVGQYVQLKPSGRNLKALCPFHQEKTPSFMVSPEKQLAYCFGCHKGGDIVAFIEEIEGVDFKEAVKILAEKCGIDPAEYMFSAKSKHTKSEKEEIYEIHKITSTFYEDYLWNSDKGKKVLEYLRNRGLKDETIRNFHFGLSPDSFEKTHLHLVKKEFSRKMIALSGIAVSKDTQSEKVYDRFRSRLIIPIYDNLGRIVGFGGRALKKDDQPKYLNSPDSPIYKKSEILYGYNFAKDTIKKEENIVITEGYFDVIMSYQAGIKNVVATSGTALTLEQIKLIKRLTKDLIFCFDTDQAGIDAAKRGFELAQKEGMNIHMIIELEAKDPADFIKEKPNEWSEIVKKTVPFMEFCIGDLIKRYDLTTLEGKKKILNELIPYLLLLSNKLEQDFYIREIAQKLDAKEVLIYDEMKKSRNTSFKSVENIKKDESISKKFNSIDLIFGLIYEYSELLENQFKEIPIEYLQNNEKDVYKIYKDHYNLLRAEDKRKEFLSCFNEDLRKKIEVISLFVEEAYATFNEEMLENELETLLKKVSKKYFDRQKRSLSMQMKEAENKGEKEHARELLEKFNQLLKH